MKANGLVDELGGLDAAIGMVKEKAKIPAGEQVSVVMYPGRRSLLDVLLRNSTNDQLESKLSQIFGQGELGQLAQQLGISHEEASGSLAQMLPNVVDQMISANPKAKERLKPPHP